MRLPTILSTMALLALAACSSGEQATSEAGDSATEVANADQPAVQAPAADPMPEVRYYLLSEA